MYSNDNIILKSLLKIKMQLFATFTQNLLAKYIQAVFAHILCIK